MFELGRSPMDRMFDNHLARNDGDLGRKYREIADQAHDMPGFLRRRSDGLLADRESEPPFRLRPSTLIIIPPNP